MQFKEHFQPNRDRYFDENGGIDPFELPWVVNEFMQEHGIGIDSNSTSSFDIVRGYFRAVADALTTLSKRVRVEVIQGSMNVELAKIQAGVSARPPEFPRTFLRMWLSNVP